MGQGSSKRGGAKPPVAAKSASNGSRQSGNASKAKPGHEARSNGSDSFLGTDKSGSDYNLPGNGRPSSSASRTSSGKPAQPQQQPKLLTSQSSELQPSSSSSKSGAVELNVPGSRVANGPDALGNDALQDAVVRARQRRATAPDIRSTLGHISERAPSFTGSTIGSDSGVFYTDYHEDVSAYETAKTLRKSMKKYSKKAQGKGGDVKPSSDAKSVKNRVRALKPDVQSNSCSTLFVDQTVSQPNLDQILRCAATAIHMTFVWVLAEPVLPEYDLIFDEKLHPLTSQRVSSSNQTRLPRITEIYDFLRAFFKAAVLKADVAIVTMVYISRLHNAGLVLQPGNWKRVVLGSVMMASKVWDDQAVWNADYCTVLPDVTVDSMNQLERAVLELLFYNVSVSSAEYAQHYFDLRMYAHKADIEDGIMLSPLDVRKARQLEAMNHIHQTDTEHTALKRVSSTDNFEPPSRHVIIS